MSNFISSISARRLDRDAAGVEGDALAHQHHRRLALAPRPGSCSTMKRSGSSEPCATARKEPMPSLATSLGPSTSHLQSVGSLASFFAPHPPRRVGVQWLAGRLPSSRANSTPAAVAPACVEGAPRARRGVGHARRHCAARSRPSGLDLVVSVDIAGFRQPPAPPPASRVVARAAGGRRWPGAWLAGLAQRRRPPSPRHAHRCRLPSPQRRQHHARRGDAGRCGKACSSLPALASQVAGLAAHRPTSLDKRVLAGLEGAVDHAARSAHRHFSAAARARSGS